MRAVTKSVVLACSVWVIVPLVHVGCSADSRNFVGGGAAGSTVSSGGGNGGDGAGAESPASTSSNGGGGATGSVATGTGGAATTTTSSTGPDDPSCGDLGQPCCGGAACDQGGCLNARCAAFGGVYSSSAGSGICYGNPLAGDTCQCLDGFTPATFQVIAYYDEGDPYFTDISFCSGADAAGADYRGVFKTGCGGSCDLPNPATGACSCPPGAIATAYATADYNGTGSCASSYVICRGGTSASFGGVYQKFNEPVCQGTPSTTAGACKTPNPFTGACSCPPGTTATAHPHRIMHPEGSASAQGYSCDAATFACIGP